MNLLRDHCAVGRLTLDEFSERTGAALVARTRGDLDTILADLPPASQPSVQATPARRSTVDRGGDERVAVQGTVEAR